MKKLTKESLKIKKEQLKNNLKKIGFFGEGEHDPEIEAAF